MPATKFNPFHDDRGRFTFNPDGGSDLIPVAKPGGAGKPPPKPPAAPQPPASPPPKAPEPPKPTPAIPAAAPKPDFLNKKPGSGKITGNVDKLTPAEKTFANELRDLGNNIEIVPTGEGRTPDFKINGVLHELKTVSGVQRTDVEGISSAVSSRILDGRGQSGNVIVDARNQNGMSLEAADRATRRAYGADTKNGIQSITILTPNGPLYAPRRP
jgi:Contact-dependent growth inhibition CdiA C-terminal domain